MIPISPTHVSNACISERIWPGLGLRLDVCVSVSALSRVEKRDSEKNSATGSTTSLGPANPWLATPELGDELGDEFWDKVVDCRAARGDLYQHPIDLIPATGAPIPNISNHPSAEEPAGGAIPQP